MRKKYFHLMLLHIFLFSQMTFGDEKHLPQLVETDRSNYEVMDWRWRTSAENRLHLYLKIKFDEVEFLQSSGKVISQYNYMPHSGIVSSKKQNFIAFLKNYNLPNQPSEQRKMSYLICNYKGDEQYSIPLALHYDDPIPAIIIADDGRSILFEGSAGSATVFNLHGEVVREFDLFENDVAALEKPIDGAVCTDAGRFVITAQKRPMTFDENKSEYVSGEPWLFCFSIIGNEHWRQPLELASTSRVAISPTGKYIVASFYSPSNKNAATFRTAIFDENGDRVMDIPYSFRMLEFSKDEKSIFFINRKQLIYINLIDKNYKKIKITNHKEGIIITGLMVDEITNSPIVLTAKSIFQNKRFEFVEPVLLQFYHKLEKKWEISLPAEKFIEPSIQINHKEIGIGFISNYKIYEEQSEK